MRVLQRFRIRTVQFTLVATALAAGIAFLFNETVAKGILAGGLSGAIGFWINAVQAEKLAFMSKAKVNSAIYRWTLFRMGLYALTFYWSFTLDPESMRGILGAVGGFFIIQIVLIFLGLTGFDLREKPHVNGTDR